MFGIICHKVLYRIYSNRLNTILMNIEFFELELKSDKTDSIQTIQKKMSTQKKVCNLQRWLMRIKLDNL